MAGGRGGWFGVGFQAGPEAGAGLEPWLVGGAEVRALRPSWSFVGVVESGGGAWLWGAGGRARVPGECRDLAVSETHVVAVREAALEAWRLGPGPALLGAQPVWRRPLGDPRQQEAPGESPGTPPPPAPAPAPARPLSADPAAQAPTAAAGGGGGDDCGEREAALPLVPGGFVEARPPSFFRPLPPALRARQLALGHEHALLLAADGRLFSWGAGRHGQLGRGDVASAEEPRAVEALDGVPMRQVAAGGWHSAALAEAGDLYLWGWNESGQLGLPARGLMERPCTEDAEDMAEMGQSRRVAVSGAQAPDSPAAPFIAIQALPALLDLPGEAEVGKVSCGSRHTAALTRTGELYTWGWGKYGQLGHRDTATSDTPKKVCCFEASGFQVADVVCGPWTTFALALPL